MAITTWLQDWEKPSLSKVEDKELNELFQEVRAIKGGEKFFIQEHHIMHRPFFKRWYTTEVYTLYICHGIDAQVMNFAPVNSEGSINTLAPKGILMNFFFGFLAGHKVASK